ncbi:MAG: hypothetical protein F6K17_24785, partial [Okeania sp. SIO3C4]|nr:hypothetical protein [Okeania sp. SIO3C4]
MNKLIPNNLQQVKLKLEQFQSRLEQTKVELNRFQIPNYSTTKNEGVDNQYQYITTLGRLEKIIIEEEILYLQGWVASFESTTLEGFKLSIAGQEIPEFKLELGLPSPDIKQVYPYLNQGDRCRFSLKVALDSQFPNLPNSLVILNPL